MDNTTTTTMDNTNKMDNTTTTTTMDNTNQMDNTTTADSLAVHQPD